MKQGCLAARWPRILLESTSTCLGLHCVSEVLVEYAPSKACFLIKCVAKRGFQGPKERLADSSIMFVLNTVSSVTSAKILHNKR